MADETDSESCIELVEVDLESVDESTDNEQNEDEGIRQWFLPLEGSRSKVWEHFGFPARDGKYCEPDKKKRKLVYCLVCNNSYKYCGNASNMQFHLKDIHCCIKHSEAMMAVV